MNELQQYYLGSLAQKLEELEALRRALSKESTASDLDGLRKIAHRLKGTGASYGFDAVSADAMALEEALEGASGRWTSEVEGALDGFLATLRRTVDEGVPG